MLGDKLKKIRKNQDITLQELADKTGFSAGYLSNIERNTTSPTVVNLQIICDALRINVSDIVQVDNDFCPLVKREQRKRLFVDEDSTLEQVAAGGELLRVTRQIFGKNFSGGMVSGIGHNVDVVALAETDGINVEIENERYQLEHGDSIYIRANTPYRIYTQDGKEGAVIWFTLQSVMDIRIPEKRF